MLFSERFGMFTLRSLQMKHALTIAGSDSCGGAGIQADLKTFSANGVYGMSVITAVTAQNTMGVFAVEDIRPDLITAQLKAVFDDIAVHAVKIGMLSTPQTIDAVCDSLASYRPTNIVLDPVMISKSGYSLLQATSIEILKKRLLPLAYIVTPNIPEAEILSQISIENISDMKKAASIIFEKGSKYVLIKGGHLASDPVDLLYDGKTFSFFVSKRINTANTHGTGCTLSSAIAANLAKNIPVEISIAKAKKYVYSAIRHSFPIGHGVGPTNHFFFM